MIPIPPTVERLEHLWRSFDYLRAEAERDGAPWPDLDEWCARYDDHEQRGVES
jgi:hypothetical protein